MASQRQYPDPQISENVPSGLYNHNHEMSNQGADVISEKYADGTMHDTEMQDEHAELEIQLESHNQTFNLQHQLMAQDAMSLDNHPAHTYITPSHDGQMPRERKRSKVSRACDECRRKKIRCDAANENGPQSCTSCKRSGVSCQFSRQPLKRGPSKGYIKELADRVKYIERQLPGSISSPLPLPDESLSATWPVPNGSPAGRTHGQDQQHFQPEAGRQAAFQESPLPALRSPVAIPKENHRANKPFDRIFRDQPINLNEEECSLLTRLFNSPVQAVLHYFTIDTEDLKRALCLGSPHIRQAFMESAACLLMAFDPQHMKQDLPFFATRLKSVISLLHAVHWDYQHSDRAITLLNELMQVAAFLNLIILATQRTVAEGPLSPGALIGQAYNFVLGWKMDSISTLHVGGPLLVDLGHRLLGDLFVLSMYHSSSHGLQPHLPVESFQTLRLYYRSTKGSREPLLMQAQIATIASRYATLQRSPTFSQSPTTEQLTIVHMATEMLDLAHTALTPPSSSSCSLNSQPSRPFPLTVSLSHATLLQTSISPNSPPAPRLTSLSHLLHHLTSPASKLHPLNVHYAHTFVTELTKLLNSEIGSEESESREQIGFLVTATLEMLGGDTIPDVPDGTGWKRVLARRVEGGAALRFRGERGVEGKAERRGGGERGDADADEGLAAASGGGSGSSERRDGVRVERLEGGSEGIESETGDEGVDQLADGLGRVDGVQPGVEGVGGSAADVGSADRHE